MNNILSAISGQFGKAIFLSTMLPVVVFVLLSWALVVPLVPPNVSWLAWVGGLENEWRLAALSLIVLLLTALLYNLNGPIIRFYEGYPWQDSVLGRLRKKVHRERFLRVRVRWTGFERLLSRIGDQEGSEYQQVLDYWNFLGRKLNNEFPSDEKAVLPTTLGNVIRSFEDYPQRQYGLEAITLWPRLVAQIDDRYTAQIDNAKSSLDFMLNSSLLCSLLAALFAVVRLSYPVGLLDPYSWFPAILVCFLLLVASGVLYESSVSRAQNWGTMFKGAFDLYRWDLLEALGPWEKPGSREGEAELWDKVCNRLIYSDLTSDSPPDYHPEPSPATVVTAEPAGIPLEISRGGRRAFLGGTVTIQIVVRNLDGTRRATGVSVRDRLPAGWLCEWDSAKVADQPVEILGTNPYRFALGDLAPGQGVVLAYHAVRGPLLAVSSKEHLE
ncbi:MAG: hypothetical protein ABIS20_19135 [Thermoanaerobaculia bacterium]